MKITRAIAFMLLAFVVGLSGCEKKTEKTDDGKLNVLASFTPIWIITANVVQGVPNVELDALLPPKGAGPHDYQMTPGDMKKLARADVFIMNGLGMESFMGDSLEKANPKAVVITASDGIPTLPETPPSRELEVGDADHDHDHEHEGHGAINPHVWVSPFNSAIMAKNIAEGLAIIDPTNAAAYRANAAVYAEKLTALGEEFKSLPSKMTNTKIVTIHNALDYLAADAGLRIVAVIKIDSNVEPRAAELAKIAEKIKAAGVIGIFIEPQFSDKMAQVLSDETGTPIFILDPVDTGELRADYYIETMRKNLTSLLEAGGVK